MNLPSPTACKRKTQRWRGARVSAALLLTVFLWLAVPAPSSAQITAAVDDGKLVFINIDSAASVIQSNTAGLGTQVGTADASEPASQRMDRIVREAAERHQLDPNLVKAVISTESGWNPFAISRKGAIGLMQLIPETAHRYGVGNAFDPAQNVEGGTSYLKWLLDKYNGDLRKSLAAYNAGERAVDQSGGVPRIPETRQYVRKVTEAYFRPSSSRDTAQTQWSPPSPPVRREVESNGRVVFTNE